MLEALSAASTFVAPPPQEFGAVEKDEEVFVFAVGTTQAVADRGLATRSASMRARVPRPR